LLLKHGLLTATRSSPPSKVVLFLHATEFLFPSQIHPVAKTYHKNKLVTQSPISVLENIACQTRQGQ